MANLGKHSEADLIYLINELNKQLIGYWVSDTNDIVRGKIADIYHDAQNNLQLLVKLSDIDSTSEWHQLTHRDINNINPETKTIATRLSLKELSLLPLYQSPPPALQTAVADVAANLQSDRDFNPAVGQPNHSEVETIPLLEEKLTVKRYKRKVGEIVVRKEIETRMVQIPIRSEKLVVERMGAKREVLTEVALGTEAFNITEAAELAATYKSKFVSIATAIQILQSLEREATDTKVRLEIITDDKAQLNAYRAICDRLS